MVIFVLGAKYETWKVAARDPKTQSWIRSSRNNKRLNSEYSETKHWRQLLVN